MFSSPTNLDFNYYKFSRPQWSTVELRINYMKPLISADIQNLGKHFFFYNTLILTLLVSVWYL